MNLSNTLYEIMGETNFDKCNDYDIESESAAIASDILNDILETAMDIAIKSSETNTQAKMNIIDEFQDENSDGIRNIMEKINMATDPEDPRGLDVEMKKLLNEIMSPPFEIVDYESLPRKDGVGDQIVTSMPAEKEETPEPTKIVEKKSRVTDLVMNSKKALNNLLDDEARKRQDEWEEREEKVIQVIELHQKKQQQQQMQRRPISPENVPLPYDDDEDALVPKPNDGAMENIDLNTKGGEGDDLTAAVVDEVQRSVEKLNEKTETPKKKKMWSFGLKLFGFKKNRNKQNN